MASLKALLSNTDMLTLPTETIYELFFPNLRPATKFTTAGS